MDEQKRVRKGDSFGSCASRVELICPVFSTFQVLTEDLQLL